MLFRSVSQSRYRRKCRCFPPVRGVVMNNRLEERGGDKVFGLHLNILPLRVQLINDGEQLIHEVSQQRAKLTLYKSYPYRKVCLDLGAPNGLYNIAFNYTHFHISESHRSAIQAIHVFEKMSIPLMLQVGRHLDQFSLILRASNQFIDKKTSAQLLECLQEDLESVFNGVSFRSYSLGMHFPRLSMESGDVEVSYVVARTPLEVSLCEIWQKVLGVAKVGITDDFFYLGGDSIRCIRLAAMMQSAGFHVSVSDVFTHKSILGLIEGVSHDVAPRQELYVLIS